mgnify:CR=1 FL=1
MFFRLVEQMAKREGVTEQLKAENQMAEHEGMTEKRKAEHPME